MSRTFITQAQFICLCFDASCSHTSKTFLSIHTHTYNIQTTYARFEVWPLPFYTTILLSLKMFRSSLFISIYCSFAGPASISNSHHRTLAIKTDVQHCLLMRRESNEKEYRNKRGHESEIKRGKKNERNYKRENVQHHLSFKTRTDIVSIDLYYNSSKL